MATRKSKPRTLAASLREALRAEQRKAVPTCRCRVWYVRDHHCERGRLFEFAKRLRKLAKATEAVALEESARNVSKMLESSMLIELYDRALKELENPLRKAR